MSDEGAVGLRGVEDSVRAAYDRLPEIESRRSTLRILKFLLPVVVLALVFGGLWTLWNTARTNVIDRQDELVQHFTNRVSAIVPRLERDAKATAERVLPRVQEELMEAQRKAQHNLPDAIARHTDGLGERLTERMNQKVANALSQVDATQRQKLQNTLPDLLRCEKDDSPKICREKQENLDRAMNEIQRAYRDFAIQELRTTFSGHLEAMGDIRKTMMDFASPEGMGSGKVNPDAPADMLVLFLELVGETLGGSADLFEMPEEGK